VASERPREFAIRATGGPTPFLYCYRFAAENGETVMKLDAEVELSGAATFLPQLARRAVRKGVDDNFATLKAIVEAADGREARPGHADLLGDHVARRLRRGPGGQRRLGGTGRGGAHLRQRPRAAGRHLPLRAWFVRGDAPLAEHRGATNMAKENHRPSDHRRTRDRLIHARVSAMGVL
jgi:hypothetical protein